MAVKSGLKREAVNKKGVALDRTKNDRYYKGPGGAGAGQTDKGSGYANMKKYAAAGSFVPNKGQKPGAKGKSRMEGQQDYVTKRLKLVSRSMFKMRKGEPMKAQENA